MVKQGIRWRIGNGVDVSIWKDNWIPRYSAFKPITPDLYALGDTAGGFFN